MGKGIRISAGTITRDDGETYEIGLLADLRDGRPPSGELFVQHDPLGANETVVTVGPMTLDEMRALAESAAEAVLFLEDR